MAELTPRLSAWLDASRLRDQFGDMSPDEIERMRFDDYAKAREAAGLAPVDPFSEVYSPAPPGRPRQAQEPQTAPEPQGAPDFGGMGMAEYAAIRSNFIRPSGTGRGLFS